MSITHIRILCLSIGLSLLPAAVISGQPNILLMMVDDLGFADFGCYGSEIETPAVDRLASEGLRFSQFYNTAKCHSSRISLLSGLYPVQAGDAKLTRATTIASVLQEAGYFTSMTGKWHLSKQPTDFGFQRYWGHLSGCTDFFKGDDSFRLNGEPWSEFDDSFYTTDANVDYAVRFIDEALENKKPFFHYIAFNAPHYPLQAPKSDIQKYLNRYDGGWDEIRRKRFDKQKRLGLFPQAMTLPPMPAHVPIWEELTARQREFESFRMAIYAAMVDRVDQNIARMVDHLRERGVLENTLIILCSDNGACPFERSRKLDIPPWKAGSYYLYDASWATVGNTPLLNYKQTQHEGGISSPLIVRWPGRISNEGRWEHSPGHLVDIMATCLDVTGADYPDSDAIEPLQGRSLVPLFNGKQRAGHDEIYFRFSSCRALRKGDWKVVSFYGKRWELYNIATDRCEQHDLALQHPEKVKSLSKRWHELAENTVHLGPGARKPVSTEAAVHARGTWHNIKVADAWQRPDFD